MIPGKGLLLGRVAQLVAANAGVMICNVGDSFSVDPQLIRDFDTMPWPQAHCQVLEISLTLFLGANYTRHDSTVHCL